MKKTIAAIALVASGTITASVATALVRPPPPGTPVPKVQTVCLAMSGTANDGSVTLSSCDSANNNLRAKVQLLENGCAEGQAALRTRNKTAVSSCMPPGMVQL